jgi:hypothetical protein
MTDRRDARTRSSHASPQRRARFGTDTNRTEPFYRDRLWGEIQTPRDAGLSAAEIIATMTRDAARSLGGRWNGCTLAFATR